MVQLSWHLMVSPGIPRGCSSVSLSLGYAELETGVLIPLNGQNSSLFSKFWPLLPLIFLLTLVLLPMALPFVLSVERSQINRLKVPFFGTTNWKQIMAADLAVWVAHIEARDKCSFSDWSQAPDHTCTAQITALPCGSVVTLYMATHHHWALGFYVWYFPLHAQFVVSANRWFVCLVVKEDTLHKVFTLPVPGSLHTLDFCSSSPPWGYQWWHSASDSFLGYSVVVQSMPFSPRN